MCQHASSSGGKALNDARPTEFDRALAHRTESNSSPALRHQPDAVVGDLELESVIEPEANVTDTRLGMMRDIGQRLLRDTICGYLDGGGQRRQPVRRIDDDA